MVTSEVGDNPVIRSNTESPTLNLFNKITVIPSPLFAICIDLFDDRLNDVSFCVGSKIYNNKNGVSKVKKKVK